MKRQVIDLKYGEDVFAHRDEFFHLECIPNDYYPDSSACEKCYYKKICIDGKIFFRKRCFRIKDEGK